MILSSNNYYGGIYCKFLDYEDEYESDNQNAYTEISAYNLAFFHDQFTYDLDGNMLTNQIKYSSDVWAYTWNAENRMTSATNTANGTFVTYAYDYQGRMFEKVTNGVTNNFVWNGLDLASLVPQGGNIIAEMTDSTTNLYTWSQGETLCANLDGETVFYAHDANKNVTDLVDDSGDIVVHYEYSPFGVRTTTDEQPLAETNPFGFSNEYFDETTGQVEFWRRKYFPQLGKFASRDPIGVQGGLNEYGICANDLINHWDEFGERPYTTGVFKMKDWKPHPRKGMANGNDGLKLAVAYEQALAFAARSLPASKYSYHYLLNSGRPLDISFGTVIEEERKLKNDIMRDISDAIEFADSMSSSGHIKSSDWTLSYAGTTKKWYYALHRVMWSGDAVVTLDNNGCVNMFVRYHLWDPYDFEDSPHRPGVLKDSDYRRLHEVNLADEFLITGKTKDINLRWKQGEYRHVKPKNINFVTGDKTYEL